VAKLLNEEELEVFRDEWVGVQVIHKTYGKCPVVDADYMQRLTLLTTSEDLGMNPKQVSVDEVTKAA
jgi:hypothetical protein